LSEPKELEQLRNRRTELEGKSRSLEEEQNDLVNRVKMLEESIAIEELESGNKTRQDAIGQLKSKIDELEQRLKNVSIGQQGSRPEPVEETAPPITEPSETEEPSADVSEPSEEEPEEAAVTITPLEEPITEEESGESFKRQHDRKKRKFF
jgi:peptidoglycan hydrolase CwlO-like protein